VEKQPLLTQAQCMKQCRYNLIFIKAFLHCDVNILTNDLIKMQGLPLHLLNT